MKPNFHSIPRARALLRRSIAALLVSVAACADITAPDSDAIRFIVGERAGLSPASGGGAGFATAAGGHGVVVVLGRIALPSQCHTVSANVQRSGVEIVATITGSLPPVSCPALAVTRDYSLRIAELSPGTYRVRAIHVVTGMTTETMLDTQIPVQ